MKCQALFSLEKKKKKKNETKEKKYTLRKHANSNI